MIDMKLIRTNPELVKENIRKKFQDEKLPLVDEVLDLDKQFRETKMTCDDLRNQRKTISKKIGALMGQGIKDEAESVKQEVAAIGAKLDELEQKETELEAEIRKRMLVIPNIIDESVPIGKDDSENVEVERFGEPVVPDFPIPYHVDIMENLNGIDIDSARKTSGNGFYYLCGDIAFLHSELCTGFHDQQGLYLLHSAVHDSEQRCDWRYELCRNGRHDVQDRGRRPLSDRYKRTLHDWEIY